MKNNLGPKCIKDFFNFFKISNINKMIFNFVF